MAGYKRSPRPWNKEFGPRPGDSSAILTWVLYALPQFGANTGARE